MDLGCASASPSPQLTPPSSVRCLASERGAEGEAESWCSRIPALVNTPTAQLKHLTVFIKQLAANRVGSAGRVGVYTSD